jgi:hypothetical protein
MTQVRENIVLNPTEFTPNLTELDLSAGGLFIAEAGPDWGEASQTVERVRRAIGEGVVSRHWPSIDCTIPLWVGADRDVTAAAAYGPLETFVGELQKGKRLWLRRDMADAGGFAGSVACQLDGGSLTTPLGYQPSEIALRLSRSPVWFATVEEESEEVTASSVRHLTFELAELLGTAPGLIRVQVKNEGSEDWRGCMVAIECDDFASDETALPKYEAQDLTPKGGAEVAEVSGAKVVKCPKLTSGWQTVLYSEIDGVGQMTHVGPRRMAFRLYDPSEKTDAERRKEWVGEGSEGSPPEPRQVQWKLEWRQLGSANWIQTTDGSTPLVAVSPCVGGYQLVDLGECRPERALAGEQRWEWRLQAMVPAAGPQGSLQPYIRDVYPATTEQWMLVKDASEDPIDGEPSRAPGTVANLELAGGTVWSTPENAKTSNNSYAEAELAEFFHSKYLHAHNLGFAVPEGATVLGVAAAVERSATSPHIIDYIVKLVKGGEVSGDNKRKAEGLKWPTGRHNEVPDAVATYGGAYDLWGVSLTAADVNSSEFGLAFAAANEGATATAKVDAITVTVYYTESGDENRICFAERSLQFTDNGIRRQHVTDDVWGELMPEGFLPYMPAPGQAGQTMRGLIVPSVGDFETRADSAAADLSARIFYRPAYLFCREAV